MEITLGSLEEEQIFVEMWYFGAGRGMWFHIFIHITLDEIKSGNIDRDIWCKLNFNGEQFWTKACIKKYHLY